MSDIDEVHSAAREYAVLKRNESEIADKRKEKGKWVLAAMQDEDLGKVKIDYSSDTTATVSIKTRENTKIDEDRLKKELGARVYNKLTSAVLDEAKLEAAIRLGDIDPNVVSSCMTTNETHYLEARFTKKRR